MKKFFAEFKAFAMRGNVIDLALGVVVGGAFGGITTSLVNDMILPFVSLLTGGLDFTAWAQGSRPGCGGRGNHRRRFGQLRKLHFRHSQLHHRRVCHLLRDQGAQQSP